MPLLHQGLHEEELRGKRPLKIQHQPQKQQNEEHYFIEKQNNVIHQLDKQRTIFN